MTSTNKKKVLDIRNLQFKQQVVQVKIFIKLYAVDFQILFFNNH